jgi:hypothetical protein
MGNDPSNTPCSVTQLVAATAKVPAKTQITTKTNRVTSPQPRSLPALSTFSDIPLISCLLNYHKYKIRHANFTPLHPFVQQSHQIKRLSLITHFSLKLSFPSKNRFENQGACPKPQKGIH